MRTDPGDHCVGIVIAAYNAERYLAETLASVRAQSHQNWECVVVDDGSTDRTGAVADAAACEDNRIRIVRRANGGVSSARNAGIAALSREARWLAFLDSDDTWLPGALERLFAAARARPDAAGVYGLAEYMTCSGQPTLAGEHPRVQRDRRRLGRLDLVGVAHDADTTFDSIVVSGTIWPPAVGLFRRDVVERAGCFDPEQRFVEDWDLFVRMTRFGPLVPVDAQVAWYRRHDSNLTKRDEQMAYYYARVRWKVWSSPDNTPKQRAVAQRVWRRLHLRWILWTATAVLRSARAHDRATALDAARATLLFGRQLLVGRPSEPDERTSRYVARFVAPRSAGKGLDHLTVEPRPAPSVHDAARRGTFSGVRHEQ